MITRFDAPAALADTVALAIAGLLAIGPEPGRAAVPEGVDPESGTVIPAQPQIGDPDRLYWNVQSADPLVLPEGCALTDPAISRALLGDWYEA